MVKKKRRHEAEAEASGVEPRTELLNGGDSGGGPRDDEPKKRRKGGGGGSEGGGESGSIIDNAQSYELATRVGYQVVASPLKIQEMEKPMEPYHEVYLNFRGSNTRRNITDYLYHSLVDAGIRAYRDDEELRVGKDIGPELLQAIKQSKISIPIFSKRYAASKWCLMELVQMVECKEKWGQEIMPIFYDVEPSEVRKQTGTYGEAIQSHVNEQLYTNETIQNWKAALNRVGKLKGWELKERTSEAEAIKEIVRWISKLKMYDVFLSFRGKDVREAFITSLNEALVQKGIKTFMDSENLTIGEEFPSKLKEAIDQSRMYIVIFSENYAESWWCLKELVQILGEKNRTKKLLPIFYKVAPGAVRAQNPRKVRGKKRSYEKALTDHESEFGKRKVKKWKEVLSKAANVNGMHLDDGYR